MLRSKDKAQHRSVSVVVSWMKQGRAKGEGLDDSVGRSVKLRGPSAKEKTKERLSVILTSGIDGCQPANWKRRSYWEKARGAEKVREARIGGPGYGSTARDGACPSEEQRSQGG